MVRHGGGGARGSVPGVRAAVQLVQRGVPRRGRRGHRAQPECVDGGPIGRQPGGRCWHPGGRSLGDGGCDLRR